MLTFHLFKALGKSIARLVGHLDLTLKLLLLPFIVSLDAELGFEDKYATLEAFYLDLVLAEGQRLTLGGREVRCRSKVYVRLCHDTCPRGSIVDTILLFIYQAYLRRGGCRRMRLTPLVRLRLNGQFFILLEHVHLCLDREGFLRDDIGRLLVDRLWHSLQRTVALAHGPAVSVGLWCASLEHWIKQRLLLLTSCLFRRRDLYIRRHYFDC